jgi:hypothetical protein
VTAHPFELITGMTTTGNVVKPDFVSFAKARIPITMADAPEVRSTILVGQQLIQLKSTGRAYSLTPGSVASDDGVNVIISADGYRFLLNTITGFNGANGTDGTSALSIVRAVATANIVVASALVNGVVIDGVTLATNDLVLLTGQTAPAENGVYVVAVSGPASRAAAFNVYDAHPGRYFSVMEGILGDDKLYRCTSNKGGTLGTTGIVIVEFIGKAASAFLQPAATTSGSGSSTTGTISASSPTLTLAAAIDFASGQGIRVNHAGAAFALNPPTALVVTPTGAAGATTYAYTVASLNATGGVGQSIANVSTATGNATLSGTNYNAIGWNTPTGTPPAAYAVYGRAAGSLVLLGIVPFGTNTFNDIGGAAVTGTSLPDWLPTTPQTGASLASWLITTIATGGGTTTLTLGANATTAATGQFVIHDDTANLQSWLTAAQANGNKAYLPAGSYRITSALTVSSRVSIQGAGYQGDSAGGYNGSGVTQSSGFLGSVIVCGMFNDCISATTDLAVQIDDIQITYPIQPVPFVTAIRIQAVAGATHANTQSSIRRVMVTGADVAINLTNCLEFNVEGNHLLYLWGYGIIANAPNFPSYQQATINGNEIWGNGVPSFQSHILMQAGGDIRIVNNKLQAGGANTNSIALLGQNAGSQNLEPMVIVGNSIEGGQNGILFNTANASFNTSQLVICGNQIWAGNNAIRVNNFGTAKWIIGFTITGNVLTVNGGANKTAVLLDNAQTGIITGNTLNLAGGGTTSTGIVLAANTTNVSVQSNVYDGGFTTKVSNLGTSNSVGVASA